MRTTRDDVAQLVKNHQADVWRYLQVLGCDRALADDLTQETFLSVIRRPFEVRSDAGTRAYLRLVARNLFIDSLRRAGRAVSTDELDLLDREREQFAGADGGDSRVEALRECLKTLTDRVRKAIHLRFSDGLSWEVSGTELGLSAEGAKSMIRRARAALRDCIESRIQP